MSRRIIILSLFFPVCLLACPQAAVDAGGRLPIHFKKVEAEDRAGVEELVEQADRIIPMGVESVIGQIGAGYYRVYHGNHDENHYYVAQRAQPLDASRQKVDLEIPQTVNISGTNRYGFVPKKQLQATLSACSRGRAGVTNAVRVISTENNAVYFALFRDINSRHALERTMTDLVYPRPYLIASDVRMYLQISQKVTLADLDHIFAKWNGTHYPDLYVGQTGVITLTDGKPEHSWFLTTGPSGYPMRVILEIFPGQRIPRVINAHYPTLPEREAFTRFIQMLRPDEILHFDGDRKN